MDFYTSKDTRIHFYKRPVEKNKGAAACRNYGLEMVKGELIQFLDSDDILHPKKLEFQIGKEEGMKCNTIFTCKWGFFSSGKNLMSRFKYEQKVYRNFRKPYNLLKYYGQYKEFMPLHCFLIPGNLIVSAGVWSEQLSNNDDAEFISRIVLVAKRIRFVPEATVFYRIGDNSNLSSFSNRSQVESAICSLDLIAKNLAPKHPRTSRIYLKNLKNVIRKSISPNFPNIAEILDKK
jgi:glycosyltransferase involved in cell wall biosynthesis